MNPFDESEPAKPTLKTTVPSILDNDPEEEAQEVIAPKSKVKSAADYADLGDLTRYAERQPTGEFSDDLSDRGTAKGIDASKYAEPLKAPIDKAALAMRAIRVGKVAIPAALLVALAVYGYNHYSHLKGRIVTTVAGTQAEAPKAPGAETLSVALNNPALADPGAAGDTAQKALAELMYEEAIAGCGLQGCNVLAMRQSAERRAAEHRRARMFAAAKQTTSTSATTTSTTATALPPAAALPATPADVPLPDPRVNTVQSAALPPPPAVPAPRHKPVKQARQERAERPDPEAESERNYHRSLNKYLD